MNSDAARHLVILALLLGLSGCAAPSPARCPQAPPSPPATPPPPELLAASANRALAKAIAEGDMAALTRALEQGADPNARLDHGMTPLMISAGLGDASAVGKLVEVGGDVHRLEPRMGASALHKAAQGGNLAVARLLLDGGAFINLQAPTHGHTPLMDAVWHRHAPMVELLLQRGANADIVASDGSTARFWAERAKHADILAILERFAADKKLRIASQELLAAAKAGDVEGVKALLDAGADVNQRAPDRGYTPLHYATLFGHTEVVRLLLDGGGDVKEVGALMKATVGHKAAYMGRAAALKLVVERGAPLDAQGPYNGYTALHDAVWHGHTEAAKVLVEAGARLDPRGHDGATPLQLAKRFGYTEIVALLEQAAAKRR